MPDWPAGYVNPGRVALTPAQGLFYDAINTGPSAGGWSAANVAVFVPIWVEAPVVARKIAVQVTTQGAGPPNIDVGIYNEQGTRLVSVGSTPVAAAGVQLFDITDTTLDPGTYYFAMCVSSTASSFTQWTVVGNNTALARVCGVREQNIGAVTLPNPATFAVFARTRTPDFTIICATTP